MQNQGAKEKKQFLKRYKKILACIDRLSEKIRNLDRRITSVSSPNYSGMPRGGVPVTVDELIADKIELEERVERLKVKARIIKREILIEIDSLEDDRYSEILERHFIECLPLESIAEKMGYTERHIYTLYKEALNAISVNSVK